MMVKKNYRFFVLGFLLFLLGCSPPIKPLLTPGTLEDRQMCFSLFPSTPWESVHKIEAVFRGEVASTLLGITRGEPSARRLQSVLLTPEGFSLFEGERRGEEVLIHRAVPPFNSPALAKGLLEDVALLFLPPAKGTITWGKTAEGTGVCRFESPDGSRTEVRKSPDQGWRILRWDDQGELSREVILQGPFSNGLATSLELQALRPVAYKLKMTLIQTGS